MAGKPTVWCCFIPDPSRVPAVLQGLEAEGQEQGPQAQGCPGPGWVMVWHLQPIHPVLPAWHGGTLCPQLPPHLARTRAGLLCTDRPWPISLHSYCSLVPHPSSSLSLSPFALSLLLFFSPHLLLSFPPLFSFLLPSPLSLSSYLIPLVFLLSACPADLHACCVEAAQLDLMPPAARSRAISGLSAALPQAGAGGCSVHPTALAHSLAPFCIAFCSSSPVLPFYILYPMLLPSLLSSPSLLPGPRPVCPRCPGLLQPASSVGARGWTKTLLPARELGAGLL